MKTTLSMICILISVFPIAKTGHKNLETIPDPAVKLTISTLETTYKLPKEGSEKNWFDLSIDCIITNTTDSILRLVSPNAYRISPHPWIVKMNGKSAHQWPGDFMCAPSFTEENKLTLKAHQQINVTFTWHTFIANFEQSPGLKKFRLKYHLMEAAVVNRYVKDIQKDLKEIESDWSNEISVRFEK